VVPGQWCEGEYVELDPPHRLVLTWGWTDPIMELPPGGSVVEVTLTEVAAGTRLRLTHTGLPGAARPLHDDGWTRFLARLAAVTANREPADYPAGNPVVRRAELEGR